MYKILYNNQVVDVLEDICFIKCLPESQKIIKVDKRQANGIMASDGDTIYHLAGTPNTFKDEKMSVRYFEIDEEEYKKIKYLFRHFIKILNYIRKHIKSML